MPAVLKATPSNLVLIPTPSITETGTVLIEWDRGGGPAAHIDWAINGERPFKRWENDVSRQGSKKLRAQLGKKYEFQLRENSGNKTLLDELVVTTQEKNLLTPGLADAIRTRIPSKQAIYQLQITPGVESVRVRFRTRQPTIPFIDVKNAGDGRLASARFVTASAQQVHDCELPLSQDPTPQNIVFKLHIFAPSMSGSPVEAEAQFRTGSRRVQVFFDHLFVHDDGDPGFWLADGDFFFFLGAGEIGAIKPFGTAEFYDVVGSGEHRSLNRAVFSDHTPAGIWVQVHAQESDSRTFFGAENKFAPEGARYFYDGNDENAIVTKWFDLTGHSGTVEIPFSLDTGPLHINFTINGRLRIETQDGAVLQPQIAKSARSSRIPGQVVHLGLGDHVGTGRHTSLQRSPSGELYLFAQGHSPAQNRWSRLAETSSGMITVVLAEDGPQIFALSDEGKAQVLNQDTGEWRLLSSAILSELVAVCDPRGTVLFAFDCDGAVFQGDDDGDWRRIADGVAADLHAFESGGGISLVARGADGEILYRSTTMEDRWLHLGHGPEGRLVANRNEEGFVFAVLREDETFAVAVSNTKPARLKWREGGDITSLLDRRFSLAGLYSRRK